MSSEEQTNTLRLIRVLNGEGTEALRKVFDAKFPPATLAASLSALPLHTTLTTLLRSRVLNKSQWDKLYPAAGVPDSKTFDISLLYALLRNVCGLRSSRDPLWTSNPPAADRSDEANIARVRWYRNDVIHNLASGVDDVTFQTYWTDVSSALKDLGIPGAQVDALKESPLDEKKFMDVLLEWKTEEKQVKDQLGCVDRKVGEALGEVKGIKQVISEGQEAVKEVMEEVIEEVQGLAQKVEEKSRFGQQLLQRQSEDVQKQFQVTLDEVRSMKEDMNEGHKTVKEAMKGMPASTEHMSEEVQHHSQKVDNKSTGCEGQSHEVLKKLAKINFKGEMNSQAKKCHPGTREWLFSEVEGWLRDEESDSRVMIILGDAGMGKTVIAATVCQRMEMSGNLAGMHFCKYGVNRYRNASLMLQSLANSLCSVLPEYREALIDLLSHNLGEDQTLDKMSVEELFLFLLQEPLDSVPDPKEPLLLVIDALDEAEYHGRNELMDIMSSYFARLPKWLKFLVTSRADVNAVAKLKDLNPLEITPEHADNLKDIELFLREKLQALVPSERFDSVLSALMEKSKGLMLYAYCTIDFLSKSKDISWDSFISSLPSGISDWYKQYLSRLQSGLGVRDDVFSRFLAALVSSREPLPVEIIPLLLKLEPSESESMFELDERIIKAIESVSSLLPLHDGKVHVFHKSFTDWLSTPQPQVIGKPRARVTEKQGHQVLAQVCSEVLKSIKSNAEVTKDYSPSDIYVLKHGIRHMLEIVEPQDQVMLDYLCDVEVLFLRLCSSHCTLYDVIEECIACLDKVPPDTFVKIKDIECILKRNTILLQARPQNVFEHIINEAECDELVSQARQLLEREKYQHILWLEVINRKDMDESDVLIEIEVGSAILSFGVSPNGKMAAVIARQQSCFNELSLWSLVTGEPIWRKQIDRKYDKCCTFSPDGRVILYGRLDQVCNVDGTFQELFDGNDHEYIKCRYSCDGKKLLTQSEHQHLMLWDATSQHLVADIAHEDTDLEIEDFKFTPCGQYIFSFNESEICLWDSSTGGKVDYFKFTVTSSGTQLELIYHPSGKEALIFIESDYNRSVLKVSSSGCICLTKQHALKVTFIFSSDGKYGAAICQEIVLQETCNKTKEELLLCPIPVALYTSCDRADSFKLVDETSVLHNKKHSSRLKLIRCTTVTDQFTDEMLWKKSSVRTCALSLDCSTIFALNSDNRLSVYNISQRGLQKYLTNTKADGLYVLESGRILVRFGSRISMWKCDFKELLWTWKCHQYGTLLCATDEIVAFRYKVGVLTVRDLRTGEVKFHLKGHDCRVVHCCIDHQNDCILTAGDSSLIFWDGVSHKQKNYHQFCGCIREVSISREKNVVAVCIWGEADADGILILDELSGERLRELRISTPNYSGFVFGTSVLVCAEVHTGFLYFMDVDNLEILTSIKCNPASRRGCQSALSCSPCSRKIAIGLESGKVLLLEIHLPRYRTRTE